MSRKKLLSFVMAICLVVFPVLAVKAKTVEAGGLFAKKIYTDLISRMEIATGDETIPVSIWTKDIDCDESAIVKQAQNNVNIIKNSATKSISLAKQRELQSLVSSNDNVRELNETQLLIEAKRKIYENIYTQENTTSVKTILSDTQSIKDSQVTWISQYTPLIKMNLTKDQINELSKSPLIEYMYLDEHEMIVPDTNIIPLSAANGTTSASIWQQATNITYLKSRGYTGSGVKVGLYDGGVLRYADLTQSQKNVFSTLYSSGRLIADPAAPTQDPGHAALCGSIIAATNGSIPGIAPGVTLYSTTGYGRAGQVEGAMEWLISQGVRIISMSVSWDGTHNMYDPLSKWFDHIAIQHDITTVQSAGNDGTSGIPYGCMSYNTISVGSNYDKNTASRTDDVWSTFSSYSTNSSLPMKPDLVAPGDGLQTPAGDNSGTSLSCPEVAGVIALLYQLRPALSSNQALTKAIMLAGINACGQLMGSSSAGGTATAMLAKTGAGLLDAKAASYIASNNRYAGVTMGSSMSTYTKTFTVSSSDTLTRVCLAWLKNNRVSGSHTVPSTPSNPACAVLYLEVKAPNGTVYRSQRSSGNVQLISFKPPVTGTYTITVRKISAPSSEPNVYFGLAWY